MGKTHKQTMVILLFVSYVLTMMFFAIVRAFGLLYFQAENLIDGIPAWMDIYITTGLWLFTFTIALRTLTKLSLIKCIILSGIVKMVIFVTYTFAITDLWFFVGIDILALFIIPFIFNEDKEMSLGYSLMYTTLLSLYGLLIVFGRGYPLIHYMTASWGLVAIFDYYLFVYLILILKGVLSMGRPCIMFWSKTDRIASFIGSAPRRMLGLLRR